MAEAVFAAVVFCEFALLRTDGSLPSLVHSMAQLALLAFDAAALQVLLLVVHTALDMSRSQSLAVVVHHACAVLMCVLCLLRADEYGFRIARLLMVSELSTVFLNAMKLNEARRALWGALFALTFFATRVLWIPYVISQLSDPLHVAVVAVHYAVNVFWFKKIVRHAVTLLLKKSTSYTEHAVHQ